MDGWRRGKPVTALGGPVLLIVAAAGAGSLYGWLIFATTFVRPGLIGVDYTAVGSDWMVLHAAATSYLRGHEGIIYDGGRLTDLINHSYGAWLGAKLPFRPWVYPPTYLLFIAPFGFLSFLGSFVAFQILTAMALVAAIVVGAPRKAWAIAGCAILCPAAAVNAVCGQNALLVAALLVGGVRLMGSRPALAGTLLGLLSVKPQFAVLAPVALVASRHWRPLLAFVASTAGLALISLMTFGLDPWARWLHLTLQSLVDPSAEWIEYGRIWGYSVWTCAVLLGAASNAAAALQLAAFVAALATVGLAFARPLKLTDRLAVLLAATCLAAPHWAQYDALLLTVAALFWLSPEPADKIPLWRWVICLLVWLWPLAGPPALDPLARLTPVLIVGFIAAIIGAEHSAVLLRIRRRIPAGV